MVNKQRIKENIIVVVVGILVLLILINIETLRGVMAFIAGVFVPVTIGFIIAYILRGPFNFVRNILLGYKGNGTILDNIKPILALTISYTMFIGIGTILLMIVVPQLWSSINVLVPEIQKQYYMVEHYIEQIWMELNISIPEIWLQLEAAWEQILGFLTSWLSSLIPR
ncbi:MAG: hypothetical protein BEN19_03620 [Epulopiscium sp. Nuni2H_MBin003]|nr:MAG: hypothetical protein BEN19_03620 [Epulopiscium sp. Nuni2H_MBin003]